jgi:hypothetical protein
MIAIKAGVTPKYQSKVALCHGPMIRYAACELVKYIITITTESRCQIGYTQQFAAVCLNILYQETLIPRLCHPDEGPGYIEHASGTHADF